MDPKKLVRMANQIAANFDYGSDKSKVAAAAADHIGRFWSPLMLEEIDQYMKDGDAELTDIARQALTQLLEERRISS